MPEVRLDEHSHHRLVSGLRDAGSLFAALRVGQGAARIRLRRVYAPAARQGPEETGNQDSRGRVNSSPVENSDTEDAGSGR